jgi:DNA-binding NtrC family response regulator
MKKKVVAIFEDDPVNRFIYRQIFLNKEEVELHIFDNPETGVSSASQITFDIVFIEIHFWGNFGGISILNKMKEVSAEHTTFVAMTSLLQQGDLEKILTSGFSLCFEKPVVFAEMDLVNFK